MLSSAQETAVPLRLGAIVSLLMLLCAPAPSARAGCSAHYLSSRTQAAASRFVLDPILPGKSVLTAHDDAPSRPSPCFGALCSGNPAVPASTVPLAPAEGDGDWALSLVPPALACHGSNAYPAEDARLVPLDHPSSVFHPPRRLSPRPTT